MKKLQEAFTSSRIKIKMLNNMPFLSNILPQNKKILANSQKITDRFGLEKMSSDKQSIFILEFARVARLRYQKRLAEDKKIKNKDKIFLEEIEKLQEELLKQK